MEEKEEIAKTDVKEIYVKKSEDNETTLEDDEEEIENAIDINKEEEREIDTSKEVGHNDDKVDNELPDDEFFDAQRSKAGKIQKVMQDSHKDMAKEENPDEVIGDFFDKPMMAKKAQMKIKKKLAKISR